MNLYIILGIIALIITYKNQVLEAFSTLDIYLKKRWELIPNLVESVKGYSLYEENTFKKIINARNKSYKEMNLKEKNQTDKEISPELDLLFAIKENYPELKANQSFQKLIKQLIEIEDELTNARKYYNGSVRLYNNKIMIFPNNLLAKLFRFKEFPMFKVDSDEKKNVEVNL